MRKYIVLGVSLLLLACTASNVKEYTVKPVPKYQGHEVYKIDASRAAPIYPIKAAKNSVQGWCDVKFSVLPGGEITENTIIECSPEGYFDKAALDASKKILVNPVPKTKIEGMHYVYIWKISR